MPKFAWEGKTREGETKTGVMEAASTIDVELRLRQFQIIPSRVRKKGGLGEAKIKLPHITGIRIKTLVIFTRQLATMIDAGLPLVQCLDILAAQEPDDRFQKIIYKVKTQVEGGSTLADALKKHPKVFDNLFVNLVAAGETGGILDVILNRLALYTEKSMKIKNKVKSAMKYPMFVLFIAGTITTLLLWKVIPTFAELYRSIGGRDLPALTLFVLNLSKNFIKLLPFIVLAIGGIIFLFITFYRSEIGRKIVDTILLKTPIFGNIIRKSSIARFTRTLGTLLSSGVPILDSLDIVAKSAGNKVIEEGILYTKTKVSEGRSIVSPLEEAGVFPKMVTQMIGVGESTGSMDIMLSKIADFYDDEVNASVDSLTALIEPVVIVLIGGIVGFVLVSMYLPIFHMAENLTKR